MKKLQAVFNHDGALQSLNHQAQQKMLIEQWWRSVLPPELVPLCNANHMSNHTLVVFAHHAAAAAKINFLQASLLNALKNLQKSHPFETMDKVTAIKVKVQVKSTKYNKTKPKPTLNQENAQHLLQLSQSLAESDLAITLNKLAKRAQ